MYLSPATDSLNTFRAVAGLLHTQLLSAPDQSALHVTDLHLRSDIRPKPLAGLKPDFVLTSARLAPSAFGRDTRKPILWNDEIAIYAPHGAVAPVRDAPPGPFSVRISDTQVANGHLVFTATFTVETGDGWTGQDWLMVPADASPWAFPSTWPTEKAPQWFAGQAAPLPGTMIHRYEFDPRTATLALRPRWEQPRRSSVVRRWDRAGRLAVGRAAPKRLSTRCLRSGSQGRGFQER